MNNLVNGSYVNMKGQHYKVIKVNTTFELIVLMEQYRIDRRKAYKVITLNQFKKNFKEW